MCSLQVLFGGSVFLGLSSLDFQFLIPHKVFLAFINNYSKTCFNRTPMGLNNLFSLDRYLIYTGSNYIDN